MVTTNNIVSFVDTAINRGLDIEFLEWKNDDNHYISQNVKIIKDNNNEIIFQLDYLNNKLTIGGKCKGYVIENLSEHDILSFRMVCIRVKKYVERNTESYFNNFFKDNKPTDIDDLDDGDNS